MFHVTIFLFYFGSNYWKTYWAYVSAVLDKYMVCTMDERGFFEFPDPWIFFLTYYAYFIPLESVFLFPWSCLFPQLLCSAYVHLLSTAVGQAVERAPVTQRARIRSPVGTSFLGEFFRGFSSPVRQMSGSFRPPRYPNISWPSLSSSLIIHYRRQWPEMLTRPKTSTIQIYIYKQE